MKMCSVVADVQDQDTAHSSPSLYKARCLCKTGYDRKQWRNNVILRTLENMRVLRSPIAQRRNFLVRSEDIGQKCPCCNKILHDEMPPTAGFVNCFLILPSQPWMQGTRQQCWQVNRNSPKIDFKAYCTKYFVTQQVTAYHGVDTTRHKGTVRVEGDSP